MDASCSLICIFAPSLKLNEVCSVKLDLELVRTVVGLYTTLSLLTIVRSEVFILFTEVVIREHRSYSFFVLIDLLIFNLNWLEDLGLCEEHEIVS